MRMGCPFPGRLALKKAGFEVAVYYTSETDNQAAIVCQANHGNAITQLGDVTKITTDMVGAYVCLFGWLGWEWKGGGVVGGSQ